ncbi:MAG: tetratricopeptide repeat protein [Candidatus Riflebacteria bacterium]|nr:tetratricopeptide repeat protein [Candidatus Riflebacteria bacterium]
MTTTLKELLGYKKAEMDRKAGRFDEALRFYGQSFAEHPDSDLAWRRAYCLRRLGRLDEAKILLEEMEKSFPGDKLLASERIWMIWEGEIKPAREAEDYALVLDAARRMIQAGPDRVCRKMAAFAGFGAAKALAAWDKVLEFCDLLSAAELTANPRVAKGRRLPSDREVWYFARIRAYMNLKKFEDARRTALTALSEFRHKLDFSRFSALALEGGGDVNGAIQELKTVSQSPKTPWYFLADLARMYVVVDELEQAWLTGCRGAAGFGDLKVKVNLLTLLARIAEARGDTDSARDHAMLGALVREREGWKLPNDLAEVLMRVKLPEPLPGISEVEKACRTTWNLNQITQSSDTGDAKATMSGRQSNPALISLGNAFGQKPAASPGGVLEESEELIGEECRGTLMLKDPKAPFAFIRANDFRQGMRFT